MWLTSMACYVVQWQNGYTNRFGIVYVDYNNGYKRYLKASAKFLANLFGTWNKPSSSLLGAVSAPAPGPSASGLIRLIHAPQGTGAPAVAPAVATRNPRPQSANPMIGSWARFFICCPRPKGTLFYVHPILTYFCITWFWELEGCSCTQMIPLIVPHFYPPLLPTSPSQKQVSMCHNWCSEVISSSHQQAVPLYTGLFKQSDCNNSRDCSLLGMGITPSNAFVRGEVWRCSWCQVAFMKWSKVWGYWKRAVWRLLGCRFQLLGCHHMYFSARVRNEF